MAMLMMMHKGNYVNENAIENVIRYITRTRINENRANELIAWGGCGVGCYADPELVIAQFHQVQKVFGIDVRGGKKLFHETFNIMGEEFDELDRSYETVYRIAVQCAERYYSMGHQVVFAIHHADNAYTVNKGLHIHFVVNAVNFMTGRKWHTNFKESYRRELDFNMIMWSFMKSEIERSILILE